MLGPVLQGERIRLEPPQREDLEVYRGWFADLEVTRYLQSRFAPSEKQEEEWYERVSTNDHQVTWRITIEGETIGNTGIFAIDWINRHGITGLVIGSTAHWGKGYASEAVRLRTTYAFRELALESLESMSLADNIGMHRALERSGYLKIGRRRRFKYGEGRWHDAFIFELLREEWEAEQG